MTKGMKTSEFLVTVVLQILFFLNTTNVWNYMPPKYSAMVQAIIGGAYMIARGIAKHGNDSSGSSNAPIN